MGGMICMSRKICVYISVLFILIIGLSALSAENVTSDEKATSDIHSNSVNDETSSTTSNTTATVKSISKYDNSHNNMEDNNKFNSTNGRSIKTAPEKNPMQLSIDDYSCKENEIVHVITHMNPEGVTEGVLMYTLDDDLLGTCNIVNVGTEFDIDTYGYDIGKHNLTVEYTASLNYESAQTTSTLTIYKDVGVTSNNTSLTSGIYSVYPENVTIYCNDSTARGDVDLYVDNVLVETYSNQIWNNMNIPIPDIKIVNQLPVIPDYVNRAGNYTWRLEFKDNQGYKTNNSISGTLEMMDYVEITLVDNITSVYPYEYTSVTYSTRPDNILGGIVITDDGYMLNGDAINQPNVISFRVTQNPGEYSLNAFYRADIITDSYYVEHGINPSFKSNTYPYSDNCNYVTLTVLKVPVSLRSFNTSFDENNDLYITMNLSSNDNVFDEYYDGTLNIYYEDTLIKSLNLYREFNDEDLENPSLINFTLDKKYNNKNLKFEYTDPYEYYDDLVFERLIDLEKKNVTLTTTGNTIRAYVGDLVEIPYSFNDTVNDGKISISYGGSEDNITNATNNGVIGFDTQDYLQGEYDLILTYYDSNVFEETSIPITLELYQQTNITADKEQIDIVLGKGNEYTVNFETSLDSWDDVIWGSIDVYIDNNIIDTIIVDDTTGNTGSITLDDYILEDITPGTHTLRAEFTTDDPYITNNQTTVLLNVGGEVTIKLPELVNAVMYKDYNITPVVVQFNGKTLKTGNLTYTIQYTTHRIDLNSINNTITQNATYDTGTYTVNMRYHDDTGTYPDTSKTFTVIVRTDTPAHFSTTYNNTMMTDVYIGLRNNKGYLINRTVNITLPNGSKIENAEINSTYLYRFTLSYIPSGENTVTIEAQETDTYTYLKESYTFNVTRVITNLSGTINRKQVNDTYGTFRLKMNQTNHYDAIANRTIQIINLETDEVIGTGITNTGGIATVNTNIAHYGDYQLKILFAGDEFFEPSTLYLNITVPKLTTYTYITVNNQTLGNTSIEVYVRNSKPNMIIPYAPVTITLPDNTQLNINTGETGVITVPLDLPVGENLVTAEYAGYDDYAASGRQETINVTPKESSTIATITNNTIRNVTVNVTVTDKLTGDALTSGNIEILDKDGNTVGTGNINTSGTVTITTTIDNKDITEITVKYMGNTNYSESEYNITNLEVTGRLSDINYTVNNNSYGNISVNVTIIDPITNTVVPNAQIIITYPDGTTETVTTDENGSYTITHELPVGENTITVTFNGNDEYNTTTKDYTFTVTQRESTTTANITNNTIRNTTIEATVTDKTTGQPIVHGDVEVVNIDTREVVGRTTLNGTNTITITTNIDTTGTYHLRVDFKGNNNYTSSNYTLTTFNVIKRASQTTITVDNNVYEDTSITITVRDPVTGTPIANAPVTITLPNGQTINRLTDTDGNINVNLDLPVGHNTITATYTGNEEYNTSTTTQTINVVKRASNTTATVTNATIRNTTVNVTVTDNITHEPVTSGEIIIKDTNTDEIVGRGTLNGTNNILIYTNIDSKGTYNLLVEYQGNDYYNSSTYTLSEVTVSGREATIETNVNNQTQGNTTITITVKDPITDTPIPNSTVTITYPNGTTETLTTDENGNITITPDLPVGENNITITYPETDEYNTTTETITINVQMRESLTSATINNNTVRNTSITVTVTDKITGQQVTSGQIEIINKDTGALIATGTLDGTNTITIPVNLPTGTYNITVNYLGNTNYTASSTNIDNINIEKRASTITITTLNDTIDDTRINITVKDPITDEIITNAPITITLPDTTTITTHTGATGTITQTLTLPADDNTITITYDGNNQYNSTTRTYTVNVKKLESTITVTRQTGYIGENITLTATITDINGNKINGGKVAFKLNDVTLKDENGEVIYATVENGIATISYYVPTYYQAKTYKLSAVYGGNNQYLGSRSNTPLLNLKQRQAKLTLTTTGDVKVGENITFHVTITDKKDTNRQINGTVIFKIDGLTLQDTNGETLQIPITNNTATYTYTIGTEYSARKHTITVVLINNTYVRSQAENNFNVTTTTTQINLNTLTMTPQTTTTITGTITDNNGNNIQGINKVAVKIDGTTLKQNNGETQYYYITDGQINIPLEDQNYNAGEHTIEVVTGARSSYTGARNNTTLTITDTNQKITKTSTTSLKTSTITTKQLVNIQADKTIALTGETNTITVQLKDTNNKNIQKGTVTFTSNGKTLAKANVKNGQALLNHKYNTPGTYTLTATYTDNTDTYTTTSTTFKIQIIQPPTTKTIITANNTSTTVGETLTYTTLFTDQYNNKINNGTAKITIQNKTTTHQITNGITITPITLEKAGKYNITITTSDAKITRTITVNKQTPKITINKPNITAGQKNTLTTTITTKQGVPLNEGKIQWKINGVTLKDNKGKPLQTQIKDGTSNTTYQIPNTWAGKTINITATYTGTNNINIKATTKNITIPQLTATATITLPKTIKTKDNITIKITIKDKNTGKTVTGNDKIAIKLNGKTISTPRLQNGTTTINYKLPLLKTNNTHNITIVYGNKNYKRLETTKTFKIQKINTTLTLKNQKTKKGQTLHIKTYIKDTNGEIMKRNDTYCIKLNGKTILTGRLKNGLLDFKLPINYKKGKTYNLTIKTGNNYYYNGVTKTIKLTVT